MRSRGPRGLPTGPTLIPIAWGHVAWESSEAVWISKGGRAGVLLTASTSVIAMEIVGGCPKARRYVQLTSHDENDFYAYRYDSSNDLGVVLATDGTEVGVSIVVYEEQ